MLWLMRLMSVCICICVRVVWQAIGVIVVFYLGTSISLACDKHQPTGIYYLRDTLRIPCLCLLPLSPQATYTSYSLSLSLFPSLFLHTHVRHAINIYMHIHIHTHTHKRTHTHTHICVASIVYRLLDTSRCRRSLRYVCMMYALFFLMCGVLVRACLCVCT